MKFTIGIITAPDTVGKLPSRLNDVFASIANNDIYDDVEVLVVGGNESKTEGNYRFIAFDETEKAMWITKKKNVITTEAKYDNIVYMHDYIALMPEWFKGMEDFNEDWKICMTKMLNADGSRFRDWTLWAEDAEPILQNREFLIPYNITNLSKMMYISGAYWIAKKSVMEEFPLNENLVWAESEDVEWSKRVREKYEFSMNPYSSVRLLKMKDPVFNIAGDETVNKLLCLNTN